MAKPKVDMGFFNNVSPNMASNLSELHYFIEYSIIAFWNWMYEDLCDDIILNTWVPP